MRGECDRELLLIEDLLSLKSIEAGISITVTAQWVASDPLTATPTSLLQIAITNTGVEIPAAELAHIFDKFYRIPSQDPWQQGGIGLGLALVNKMVKQLGGTIQVTSANHQTCFTIGLTV